MTVSAALVLVAELVNTAIENVCDALHPSRHPLIGAAKDCASAAVLVANSYRSCSLYWNGDIAVAITPEILRRLLRFCLSS